MALGAPLRATLTGLGHFRHEVVFVKVKDDGEGARLASLAAAVRRAMVDGGVMEDGDASSASFVPHVTLAKTSKVKRRNGRAGRRKDEREGVTEKRTRAEESVQGKEAERKGVGEGEEDTKATDTWAEADVDVRLEDNTQEGEDGRRENAPSQVPAPEVPQVANSGNASGPGGGGRRRGHSKVKLPIGELMAAFSELHLGVVEVTQLELCSMMAPKDEDGYYAVRAAVSFSAASLGTVLDGDADEEVTG